MLSCTTEEHEKVQAPSYGDTAPSPGEKAPSYGETAPSYGKADTAIERGKTLFNDMTFGNGTAGKSCNTCHPGGRGLEAAGDKKEFHIMGQTQNSLEEAVNICIEMPLKGTAIDPESQDMKDIAAYIRSLNPHSE